MTLYPNADKAEEKIGVELKKVKELESMFDAMKKTYEKNAKTMDPLVKTQSADVYKKERAEYIQSEDLCAKEFRKSVLTRMEDNVVCFKDRIGSYSLNI